ncbi:MAG: ankyrin repeat domain-containing protein [archaeon]|nr:ankyrin repeat domain-containing protein [archaeon]
MIAAGRGFGKLVEWYGLFLTQQKPRRGGGGGDETFQRTLDIDCFALLGLFVATRLIDHGALLNLQNELGETALHFATVNKYFLIGETLIKRGANPKISDKNGYCVMDLGMFFPFLFFFLSFFLDELFLMGLINHLFSLENLLP